MSDSGTGGWNWHESSVGTDALSILLMGDTNIQFREDPSDTFKNVLPTLKEADLRLLNLEGPFAGASTDPRNPDIPHKKWRHSEPDQVAGLVTAGIDAVGVANNVTYPWQALMRSLDVLSTAGIPYAGGGKNLEAAHSPLVLERKGARIGFMQYAATVFPYNHAATSDRPGIAEIKVHTAYRPPRELDKPGQPPDVHTWLDEVSSARMVSDIRGLSDTADVTIVSFHWGVSDSTDVVSYQSDIARRVIDAGADVVFGHGPHRYQKVELYRGKPILHSLAQFVFDDRCNDRYRRFREGLLARLLIKKRRLAGVSLVPSWREDDNFVRLYDPNSGKGRELFGYLLSVNGNDGAALALRGQEIRVDGIS